jgi:hypothetical protein
MTTSTSLAPETKAAARSTLGPEAFEEAYRAALVDG